MRFGPWKKRPPRKQEPEHVLRIATIDNLSARAFRLIAPAFPAQVVLGSPSETYRRMASGQFDAALVPVVRTEDLGGIAETLGAYGIACLGTVSSVRLFTRGRLADVVAKGGPFHATPQSQTSRALLACLCRMDFSVEPVWTEDRDAAQARLLIGEDALDAHREEHAWPGQHDMGQWWHERTGLPFVFARWVVRSELSQTGKEDLLHWLEENALRAATLAGRAVLTGAVIADGHCQLSPQFLRGYYARLRPRLTFRDLRGLERFLELHGEGDAWTRSA